MTKQLNSFFEKCNDICNKFNVTDDVAGCFLVNYGDKSDICRNCFRKTECCKMNEETQKAAYEEQCEQGFAHQEQPNEDYFEGINDYLDGTMSI